MNSYLEFALGALVFAAAAYAAYRLIRKARGGGKFGDGSGNKPRPPKAN